jgi:hypothetical protein
VRSSTPNAFAQIVCTLLSPPACLYFVFTACLCYTSIWVHLTICRNKIPLNYKRSVWQLQQSLNIVKCHTVLFSCNNRKHVTLGDIGLQRCLRHKQHSDCPHIVCIHILDAPRHLAQAQTAEGAWQASQAEERVLHQAGWSGRFWNMKGEIKYTDCVRLGQPS